MNVVKMITEGCSKGGVNEPPTTPRPPAPVGYGIPFVPKEHLKNKTRFDTPHVSKNCVCPFCVNGSPPKVIVLIPQVDKYGKPTGSLMAMSKKQYDGITGEQS